MRRHVLFVCTASATPSSESGWSTSFMRPMIDFFAFAAFQRDSPWRT
jgi:hypothetical protein